MRHHERMIMLSVIDQQWKDHLLSMDHLKEGISPRARAARSAGGVARRRILDMFEAMMQRFQEDTVRYLYLMRRSSERPPTSCFSCAAEKRARAGVQVPLLPMMETATAGVRRAWSPLRPTSWKKPSRAANAANSNKPRTHGAGDAQPVQQVVRGQVF